MKLYTYRVCTSEDSSATIFDLPGRISPRGDSRRGGLLCRTAGMTFPERFYFCPAFWDELDSYDSEVG